MKHLKIAYSFDVQYYFVDSDREIVPVEQILPMWLSPSYQIRTMTTLIPSMLPGLASLSWSSCQVEKSCRLIIWIR